MKKTIHDGTKKLSIEIVTVRKLESELTPEQLKVVAGGQDNRISSRSRQNC